MSFVCKNCHNKINKSERADIWLHEDGYWMCLGETHAEPLEPKD
jgi:hypothetical protein